MVIKDICFIAKDISNFIPKLLTRKLFFYERYFSGKNPRIQV
jgi:hypothetical protein